MSLHLTNLLPVELTWLLAAALLAALAYGTVLLLRKRIPWRWVAILGGLRLAIIGLFVLVLLQPVISLTKTSAQLPELVVLIDSSRSMGQPGAQSGTRLDEVRTALYKTELIATLGQRYRLHWFNFDASAFPMDEADLTTLQPVGSSTRYAESLTAAWNHLRALGKTPERLLLVSDGNDLGQTDPVETARALGVVIDTLAPTAASSAEAPRVSITDVQCAPRVLLGSETHFRITLTRTGAGPDQPLTLRMSEDGKKVWDQEVVLKSGQAEKVLTLAHRPATTGTKQYEFRVSPSDMAPAAAKPFPLAVQVVDNKYEALILEDTWRWEFKFLRRLFEDDPSFRFTALLPRGKSAFLQFGSPNRRINLIGFPQGRAELEGFDTFILGDVNPHRWPPSLARMLSQLVIDEGKSLVVVAGPNLAQLAEVPELARLLPVELAPESSTPVGGPVEVRFGQDSAASSFFFQIRSGDADKLPPLDQIYPPLRKRPAATVLLEAAKQSNSYGNLIVMADHTVGRGRVLFIGTDTLWKWHTLTPEKDGPTPYSQFWQQAFRALTPERSYQGGTQLWLQTNRTRGEVGRPVALRAEIQSLRPVAQPRIEATVELPDKRRLPLSFAADPAQPGLFRAQFEPQLPGPHTVRVSLTSAAKPVAENAAVVHVDEARGELNDQGIDRANLARLAAASGGKIIDPVQSETWPSPADSSRLVTQVKTIDLWNNFALLLLLCGVLAADWVIRIMKGFV